MSIIEWVGRDTGVQQQARRWVRKADVTSWVVCSSLAFALVLLCFVLLRWSSLLFLVVVAKGRKSCLVICVSGLMPSE